MGFDPIVAIGDAHMPFMDRKVFEWVLRIVAALSRQNKHIHIVQLGDLFDLYSFSKFAQRLRMTPRDEIKEGRNQAEEAFKLLTKAAPNATIWLIRGNHCARIAKRITEQFGSALDGIFSPDHLWKFPNVNTTLDTKDILTIQGINFTHGHYSRLGKHMEMLNFQNTVTGHSHRGGVYYTRMANGDIKWELNAGYIADPFSPELNYRPVNRYFNWTHGVGIIDCHGPRFVPYKPS